jgi:phage regulator Rha-like protein
MSGEHHDTICRSLENLEKHEKTAMLSDRNFKELQATCATARKHADRGDYEEAKRLLAFARDFLDEESRNPGFE